MTEILKNRRTPDRVTPLKKAVLHMFIITAFGALLGFASKMFDIYTVLLGDIFSQMSVWIFICTVIAVYGSTPKRAGVNVFFFCAGMLTAYYLTAELTGSVYSVSFIYGWGVFALFSPAMGFCAWYAKGKGALSKIITCGIVVLLFIAAAVMFDKIRTADIVFALLIIAVLQINGRKKLKKKERRYVVTEDERI